MHSSSVIQHISEDNPLSPFFQSLVSTIIGAIFGGSGVTFLTFLIQRHDRKTDKRQGEYAELSRKISEIADAVKGQGHDRVIYLGGRYIQRGGSTKEGYENLYEYIYLPYKALGGNGTAEKVMVDDKNLPIITQNEAYERELNV